MDSFISKIQRLLFGFLKIKLLSPPESYRASSQLFDNFSDRLSHIVTRRRHAVFALRMITILKS
jgi:hypothetical protein